MFPLKKEMNVDAQKRLKLFHPHMSSCSLCFYGLLLTLKVRDGLY